MSATQLSTYDLAKGTLRERGWVEGPVQHSLCSFVASIALTTAICPLDVVLTHYQIAPPASGGALGCARALARQHGIRVFYRGWLPLWLRFLPSTVLTFVIYEHMRKLLVGEYMR